MPSSRTPSSPITAHHTPGRPRARVVLVGLIAVAGVGAGAGPAQAFSEHTECSMAIANDSGYMMRMYDEEVVGSGSIKNAWIYPGEVRTHTSDSWYPVHAHCSIRIAYALDKPDGTQPGDQGAEFYVYDPNSGRNNHYARASGAFASRTIGADDGYLVNDSSFEDMDVRVCARTGCPPPVVDSADGVKASSAFRTVLKVGRRVGPRQAVQSAGLLRRGDLGRGSWRRVTSLGHLGRYGDALAAQESRSACVGDDDVAEPTPLREGLTSYARRDESEFVAVGHGVYATRGQARSFARAAVAQDGVSCVARALTSKERGTRAAVQRRVVSFAGRRLTRSRLVLRTSRNGRVARDYVDRIAVQRGRAAALLMVARAGRPPVARDEADAVRATYDRLR